jgi:hypothetical protein
MASVTTIDVSTPVPSAASDADKAAIRDGGRRHRAGEAA